MINLFQPMVGDAEIEAIRAVFDSSWLGPGSRVQAFEQKFAKYIRTPTNEFVSITSCTEALFQAIKALQIGPGDDVIMPSVSFIGAAHAVSSAGARIVLCDVDPATLNPTTQDFERAITPKTRAAIVLHYGGYPGNVAEIAAVADLRSIYLIEDAAIGLGSFSKGRACGTFGEIGCWSFDSMKTVTTGDGGMVWAKRPEIAETIRNGIKLGVSSTGFHRHNDRDRWWEVDPVQIGRWARMNDLAACIGLVQMECLPSFLKRRSHISRRYDAGLSLLSWLKLPATPTSETARTFYWVQTAPKLRDRLANYLSSKGIYTSFRYWPLHRTRMYHSAEPFPGAELASETTLLLPMHQGLTEEEVDHVIEEVCRFSP